MKGFSGCTQSNLGLFRLSHNQPRGDPSSLKLGPREGRGVAESFGTSLRRCKHPQLIHDSPRWAGRPHRAVPTGDVRRPRAATRNVFQTCRLDETREKRTSTVSQERCFDDRRGKLSRFFLRLVLSTIEGKTIANFSFGASSRRSKGEAIAICSPRSSCAQQ